MDWTLFLFFILGTIYFFSNIFFPLVRIYFPPIVFDDEGYKRKKELWMDVFIPFFLLLRKIKLLKWLKSFCKDIADNYKQLK